MSETKHTPGPWQMSGAPIDGFVYPITGLYSDAGGGFPVVAWAFARRVTGEGMANARLVVAAPELLDALKETLAIATRNEEGDFADRARAIIDKAEGR